MNPTIATSTAAFPCRPVRAWLVLVISTLAIVACSAPPPMPAPAPIAAPVPTPEPSADPASAPVSGPVAHARARVVAVIVRETSGRPVGGAMALLTSVDPSFAARATTDGNGYAAWFDVPASLRAVRVTVTATGFGDAMAHDMLQTDDDEDVPAVVLARLRLAGGERGRLRVVGTQFVDEDGTPWVWRECTDFSLLYRFVRGEDLNDLLDDRIKAGCRIVRVLLTMENIAHLWPQEIPGYDAKVGALADLLAARGVRLDAVVLADARNKVDAKRSIMPDLAGQQAFFARMVAVLTPKWNVFLSLCNECDQNGVDPAHFQKPPPPLLSSRGSLGELPPIPPWDFSEIHGRRTRDWPRDAKSSQDVRDGWSCGPDDPGCTPFAGTHNPVVQGEPMGADETDQPGHRSANPDDFAQFAALSTLMGAGATFHSQAGTYSVLFGPVQRASATAFFRGLTFPPADAQTRPYQRGAADGGGGIGDMPLVHFDRDDRAHANDGATRSYCKGDGVTEWCVAAQPAPAWRAVGRNGWRVVEQPQRGLVKLTR